MNDNEKISYALTSFNVLLSLETSANPGLTLDDKLIDELVSRIHHVFRLSKNELSLDQIETLKKKIKAENQIYQDDGDGLLEDYEHPDWYLNAKPSINKFYWNRYKRYLREEMKMPSRLIQKMESTTLDDLTSYLGDPNSPNKFERKGLVVGDVQSGKTSTYIGLICNAADAGYKIIILLTGTIENLRRQTQIRVEEGFIGHDSSGQRRVGVGNYEEKTRIPMALTSRDSDFVGISDRNTVLSTIDNGTPIILVLKKNATVLGKLYKALKASNIADEKNRIKAPLLLIDDEADNASINTKIKELDPTTINKQIRLLLNLFEKTTYVGFTATPFANIFILPNTKDEMLGSDLFPEHFIYSLKAPSNYMGATVIFDESKNHINHIIDYDDSVFPFSHDKNWNGHTFFPSFYEAIIAFLLANTIRDLRGDKTAHRTMLINVSRFIRVQYEIEKIVNEYLSDCQRTIQLNAFKNFSEHIHNPMMSLIYHVWESQYKDKAKFTWEEISKQLFASIETIKVIVVNSTNKDKIQYDKYANDGIRVIAIGGLALSRGLTLEGLVVSYFYRNTCTYDVLMQMGRWFGYRNNYEDLCKIWIPYKSAKWYQEIAEATELLKNDIKTMVSNKMKPRDFGIRVRNDSEELGITAPNKMRYSTKRVERNNYYGRVFETPYLSTEVTTNINNVSAVKKLCQHLKKRDPNVRHPYFRCIGKEVVFEFMRNISIDPINTNFDTVQLSRFIIDNDDERLDNFDILFMQGRDNGKKYAVTEDLTILPVERQFSVEGGYIRINAERARLGAKQDTSFGLSQDTIEDIENQVRLQATGLSNKSYLIENRNPLLIIYFIILNNGRSKNMESRKQTDRSFHREDLEEMKFNQIDKNLLVGFALCFPTSSRTICSRDHIYVVNEKYDYYNLFFKEEQERLEQNEDEFEEDLQ